MCLDKLRDALHEEREKLKERMKRPIECESCGWRGTPGDCSIEPASALPEVLRHFICPDCKKPLTLAGAPIVVISCNLESVH